MDEINYDLSWDELVKREQSRFKQLPQKVQASAAEYWLLQQKFQKKGLTKEERDRFFVLADLTMEYDISPLSVDDLPHLDK